MLIRKLMSCTFAAGAGAGVMLLSATVADAAGGCGAGFHRNLAGVCRHDAVPGRHCQPGFRAISYPNGNGYRCRPV
jgi:hypothetical protein